MSKPILLKAGRVIDPSRDHDEVGDVLISDGRVADVGVNLKPPDAEVMDISGKVAAPGLIDVHVHFREPGMEEAETIATGARAAAAGGFTGVCAMPNTDPVTDNQAAVGFVVKQGEAAAGSRVFPIAAVTIGQRGEQLTEFGELVHAGAVAVSDDGHPVASSQMMRMALEYSRSFDIPVADHCEDPTLTGGSMHEGVVSSRLGLKGIPSAAEEIMVARDVLLAELTGGHVHLCHMSTRGSVDIIRRAKEKGINVTAEVTPHHLSLTHDECADYDTSAKMNPPLREADDVEACLEGLADGTLDVIATDHAPHHYETKEKEFENAPFGVIGLETALGVAISQLVVTKKLTLPELVYRMSTLPARIFHLPGGSMKKGDAADIVVFDPSRKWTVTDDSFRSKSRNSPYGGHELTGQVHLTMVDGRVIYRGES